ncbi:hypothetical protein [Ruegeria atlantica]|uniref:hypothetical protein n=1 Tax=Ruegeria atlantica TaxID=81569 RepID=UPI001480DBE9|nr:hypothetical protein [Ruegeria atlantica]
MTKSSGTPQLRLPRLRDIGWKLWDPIGLLGPEDNWQDEECAPFADEYDAYLQTAAVMLRRGEERRRVVDYLVQVEAVHMGLGERTSSRKRAEDVADAIIGDKGLWTH